MKIVFNNKEMAVMAMFSRLTKAKLKDCIIGDSSVLFIVEQGEIAKAIGKKGSKAKLIEKSLNRKIKILEFNPELLQFVKNLVFPLKLKDIAFEDNKVIIVPADSKTRGRLIGHAGESLRKLEAIIKRYFDITEVVVKKP